MFFDKIKRFFPGATPVSSREVTKQEDIVLGTYLPLDEINNPDVIFCFPADTMRHALIHSPLLSHLRLTEKVVFFKASGDDYKFIDNASWIDSMMGDTKAIAYALEKESDIDHSVIIYKYNKIPEEDIIKEISLYDILDVTESGIVDSKRTSSREIMNDIHAIIQEGAINNPAVTNNNEDQAPEIKGDYMDTMNTLLSISKLGFSWTKTMFLGLIENTDYDEREGIKNKLLKKCFELGFLSVVWYAYVYCQYMKGTDSLIDSVIIPDLNTATSEEYLDLVDAFQYEETNDRRKAYDELYAKTSQIFYNNMKVLMSAQQKPEVNGKCPCGSGKKYKECCGAKLQYYKEIYSFDRQGSTVTIDNMDDFVNEQGVHAVGNPFDSNIYKSKNINEQALNVLRNVKAPEVR